MDTPSSNIDRTSYCFGEAFERSKMSGAEAITTQQYIDCALVHLQGIRHPKDNNPSEIFIMSFMDPWAGALAHVALRSVYTPLSDTEVWKWNRLLNSCIVGNMDSFKSILGSMDSLRRPDPIQPAACMAAQNGHFDLMRYCLEHGAKFDRALDSAAEKGVSTSEEMEYLYQRDWNNVRSSHEAAIKQVKSFIQSRGEDCFQAKWLRENALPPGYKEVDKKSLRRPGFREKDDDGRWSSEQLEEWFGDLPW